MPDPENGSPVTNFPTRRSRRAAADAAGAELSSPAANDSDSLHTPTTIVVEESASRVTTPPVSEPAAPARPFTRRELRERRLAEQAEIVAAADAIDVSAADDEASDDLDAGDLVAPANPSDDTAVVSGVAAAAAAHADDHTRVAFTLPAPENAHTAASMDDDATHPVASVRLGGDTTAPMPVPAAMLPASPSGHKDLPSASTRRGLREKMRSARSTLAVALVIPGLVGTFAIPAYALAPAPGGTVDAIGQPVTRTADGQSLTVAQTVAQSELGRDGYDATSQADLAQSAAGLAFASSGLLADYTAPTDSGWWRPAPGAITSPYGPRSLICNGVGCSNNFHEGIDFGGACGTPIKAAADGLVTFVGNAGAFGNRVIIKHNDTEETIYGHILSGSFQVAVGDVVKGGDVIADIGATGVVSGCHLDLKVQINGEHTDPAIFLRSKGVTV